MCPVTRLPHFREGCSGQVVIDSRTLELGYIIITAENLASTAITDLPDPVQVGPRVKMFIRARAEYSEDRSLQCHVFLSSISH